MPVVAFTRRRAHTRSTLAPSDAWVPKNVSHHSAAEASGIRSPSPADNVGARASSCIISSTHAGASARARS